MLPFQDMNVYVLIAPPIIFCDIIIAGKDFNVSLAVHVAPRPAELCYFIVELRVEP